MNNKLNEPIYGYWYLPELNENSLPGVLAQKLDGGFVLKTFGGFHNKKGNLATLKEETFITVIHGVSSEDKKISLFQVDVSFRCNSQSSYAIYEYHCCSILIGKHMLSKEERVFNGVKVRFNLLSYFAPPQCVNDYIKENNAIQSSFLLTQKDGEDYSERSNEIIVSLREEGYKHYELTKTTEERTTVLILKSNEKMSLNELKYQVRLFTNLLTIACLYEVSVQRFDFFDFEDIIEYTTDHSTHTEYNYFERGFVSNSYEIGSRNHFLFSFEQIQDNFSPFIKNWFPLAEDINTVLYFFIDTLTEKIMHPYKSFSNVIRSVEGFYIHRRKDVSDLKQIIYDLLQENRDIDLVRQQRIDVDKIKDTRDYLMHLLPENKKEKRMTEEETIPVVFQLQLLLTTCLLKECGLSQDTINRIYKESYSFLILQCEHLCRGADVN